MTKTAPRLYRGMKPNSNPLKQILWLEILKSWIGNKPRKLYARSLNENPNPTFSSARSCSWPEIWEVVKVGNFCCDRAGIKF